MKHEQQLKIQALLDGELSPQETAQTAAWIESSPDAQALYHELRATSQLITQGEPIHTLSESRQFYWSQIDRQIQAAQTSEPSTSSPLPWWLKLLAPVSAAAALLAALVAINLSLKDPDLLASQEIESSLEEIRTFSFHAPQAGMTVVWVENRINW
jgi:anti-sigma factor RsiW